MSRVYKVRMRRRSIHAATRVPMGLERKDAGNKQKRQIESISSTEFSDVIVLCVACKVKYICIYVQRVLFAPPCHGGARGRSDPSGNV